MDWNKIGTHILDILKGTAAAMVTAACLAALQYLGAQIPALIDLFAPGGAAVAAIKGLRHVA